MKIFWICMTFLIYLATAQRGCSPSQCLTYNNKVAAFAVQYAACSNVLTHFKQKLINWTYAPCVQAQAAAKMSDIQVFTNDKLYLLVLVAYDTQRKIIVVSFRATVCGNSYVNAGVDFDFIPTIYINSAIGGGCKILSGCTAHNGFMKSYNSLKDRVRSATSGLVQKYKNDNPTVLVTGISLGGALAAHASYDLSVYFKHIGLKVPFMFYTYGQPRIGNKRFIQQIDKEIDLVRIINQADPVPHLPPRKLGFARFYNPGVEIFIDKANDGNPEACNGDGEECSLNRYPTYQLCDHLAYPTLKYNAFQECEVKVCQSNGEISDHVAAKEYKSILQFLINSCKEMCKEGSHPAPCMQGYPPELKCDSQQQAKFLLEDALRAIESPDAALSERQTDKKKSALCMLPICKKGVLVSADEEEL